MKQGAYARCGGMQRMRIRGHFRTRRCHRRRTRSSDLCAACQERVRRGGLAYRIFRPYERIRYLAQQAANRAQSEAMSSAGSDPKTDAID